MEISFRGEIFKLDHNQIIAFKKLQKLSKEINNHKRLQDFLFWRNNLKSIYIYGNVGRGKSMLINYFFQSIYKDKIYFHFNDFMQKIHHNLHKIRSEKHNQKNIIHIVVNNIIKNSKVIFLDEFQVDDIVDAMILSDIFKYIFQKKIIVIFTSNFHPEQLYLNGLQREVFLSFINNILYKRCDILNLDGNYDYRSKNINRNNNFFHPINDNNKRKFNEILKNHIEGKPKVKWEGKIMGRKVTIDESYQDIAVIDFNNFFGKNSGIVDYIQICKIFKILFIKNLPTLNNSLNNETKRFILFIDEAYENNVNLIILSENSIDKIYDNGLLYSLFQRTASRLKQLTN